MADSEKNPGRNDEKREIGEIARFTEWPNTATSLSNLMNIQQDWAQFCSQRLQSDMETARAFAQCRMPADAAKVWADATHQMVRDYQDQASRVFDIMTGNTDNPQSRSTE